MVADERDQRPAASAGATETRAIEHLSSRSAWRKRSNSRKRMRTGGPKRVKLELKKVLSLRAEELPSAARLSVLFKQRCPEAVQPRQRRLLPPPRSQSQRTCISAGRWMPKKGSGWGAERVNVQEIRDMYSGLMITSQAFVTTRPD